MSPYPEADDRSVAWTSMDCEEARRSMTALLGDDRAPVDRRALDEHLSRCRTCAWPTTVVGQARPPTVARTPRQRRRHRAGFGYLAGLIGMVVLAVALGPVIYFHLEGKAPPPLQLPVGPGGAVGPLNGTWAVGRGSAAEYRVEEDLFDHQHLAVGRTSKVTGAMTIAGATVTSGRFKVDLASISSGNVGRDTVFRDHLLDTGSHPDATFNLTRPIDMGSVPTTGARVTEQATGTLELRGVTRPVSFPLTAERHGSSIDVSGELTIRFSLWHIPDPSFAITRVSPLGTIDLLFLLDRRAA